MLQYRIRVDASHSMTRALRRKRGFGLFTMVIRYAEPCSVSSAAQLSRGNAACAGRSMMFRPAIIFLRLCHGTVLTALRGVHRFTSAQATIFIATKQPVSTRAKDSMYPRPARLRLCAAKPHKGSAPRDIASAPRPLHAALPCGGKCRSKASRGRASGGH